MYVVFLLNKKLCIGCTIHLWYLMLVTCCVSGKLVWCRYVVWYTKYSVTGNRKAVYTYIPFIPPLFLWKGDENLYPVCDLTFGVLWCHIKFTGAGLLSSNNVTGEMDKQYTRFASYALGNNRSHDRLLKK